MTATSDFDTQDERTLPTVVYALYLLGLVFGITILVGVIMAYVNRTRAGFVADSHYRFQIRTFWIGALLWLISGVCFMWGAIWGAIPFIGLIGLPFVMMGISIVALTHLWFGIRCILGLVYISRGDAYPRPRAWLA